MDVAALPSDADTLRVRFTLRVLGGAGRPSACNSAAYASRLAEVVEGYQRQYGFDELAMRYAHNLANGRFLWRNRVGAEAVEVQVTQLAGGEAKQQWTFNALEVSVRDFTISGAAATARDELKNVIASGLTGDQHVLLQVTAYVRMGAGQEVYPSQELVLDRGRGDKSKTLYDVSDVAAMHSQKVGNAIRAVDTWYPDAKEFGPIAAEPYGSVTTQGTAFRQPKQKLDFYNLLDRWVLKGEAPDEGNQHYLMAILVRGGVFGEAG